MDWSDEFFKGDSEIVGVINDVLQKASDAVQKFLENDLLAQVQVYLTSIASGVIYTLKFLLNLVVGIIVSIYVLASQETFAGQAKKISYAMFKPVRANVIVETVRKSNEIFGGFISGKLLDSAIIGILAYVVLTIMRMPDTILLAVIIGVTNIIPFFRTVYRSNSVIPYRCIAESAAGSVLSHFHLYSPADRRQYYRTEDPRRFYRSQFLLGGICHSGIWRAVGIPGHAARCAAHGSNLLCGTEAGILFSAKAGSGGRYGKLHSSDAH